MIKVIPFNGLLYNKEKVEIKDVIAPPYDVITPEARQKFHNASPYNITHLILPDEKNTDTDRDNKYTRAAGYLDELIKNKIIVQDTDKCFYVYSQRYEAEGMVKERLGFIGLLKIEDFGASNVHPHEHTFDKPKQDRMRLIQETRANLSPIFALYPDAANDIRKIFLKNINPDAPYFEVTDKDNVIHKLFKVSDKKVLDNITALMRDKEIFIADGHHRYEASALYRGYMRKKDNEPKEEKPYDYVMACFVGLSDDGLTILPTHRLIKTKIETAFLSDKLKQFFYVESMPDIEHAIQEIGKSQEICFGMYYSHKLFILKLKDKNTLEGFMRDAPRIWQELDTAVLNKVILNTIIGIKDKEEIEYSHSAKEAIEAVNGQKAVMCFLLRATTACQVQKAAVSGVRMPEKSTFFYPKLLSGLAINRLE